MAHTKVFSLSWGNGHYTRKTMKFNDEQHEENWKKFMNKRGAVIKDEVSID
jgi:hypothetical protein